MSEPPRSAYQLPAPSPEYSPGAVVELVMAALSENDTPFPDAGLRVAYHFSSPAQQRASGTFEQFCELVRNPIYEPLLNHRAATFSETKRRGGAARRAVLLIAEDGKRVGFVVSLSQQEDGPYEDCWMTDSVRRVGIKGGGRS
jgi:hypothetical protein